MSCNEHEWFIKRIVIIIVMNIIILFANTLFQYRVRISYAHYEGLLVSVISMEHNNTYDFYIVVDKIG